jgi:hypothetical protein
MENITENKIFEETSDIELQHTDVDNILSEPPVWLVRVGSYMIYGLVLIIILIAAIIKYPDTIIAEVVVNTSDKASMTLPYSNIAKQIKQNTDVNIELNNYPAKDFGFLTAKTYNIEYSAITQQYTIILLLPKELTLNKGKKIIITADTKGNATILLNNKSLLQRVFEILLK